MRARFASWVRTIRGWGWRRRAGALTAVIAIHALLLLMLLRIAPPPFAGEAARKGPTVVDLLPDAPEPEPEASEAEQKEQTVEPERRDRRRESEEAEEPPPSAQPVAEAPSTIWQQLIPLTREELQQADLSQRRRPDRQQAEPSPPASFAVRGGRDAEVVGTAPNGEPLYAAEWYREPTDAELAPYLPPGQTGWGTVACRMVERFRVEDCVETEQFPPGSGFSRAVRQASFQFRVRPPRVGGKALIGSWVRIKITISERPKAE